MLIVLIGLCAGVIGGMGIGGGVILIPLITSLARIEQKMAQSINLLYFIPTALAAVTVYLKRGTIKIKPLLPIAVSGMVGGAVGAAVANMLDGRILRMLFGAFLVVLSVREIYSAGIFIKTSKK